MNTIGFVEDSDLDYEMAICSVTKYRPDLLLVRACRIDQATALLEDHRPVGLVVDLNLPDGNGIDLIRELRGRPEYSQLSIVVFSTSTNPIERRSAIHAGADAIFAKPTSAAQFIQEVVLAVDSAATTREKIASRTQN